LEQRLAEARAELRNSGISITWLAAQAMVLAEAVLARRAFELAKASSAPTLELVALEEACDAAELAAARALKVVPAANDAPEEARPLHA
jgi:hypothetical protein